MKIVTRNTNDETFAARNSAHIAATGAAGLDLPFPMISTQSPHALAWIGHVGQRFSQFNTTVRRCPYPHVLWPAPYLYRPADYCYHLLLSWAILYISPPHRPDSLAFRLGCTTTTNQFTRTATYSLSEPLIRYLRVPIHDMHTPKNACLDGPDYTSVGTWSLDLTKGCCQQPATTY